MSPKPDNRADNAEHLQKHIDHTVAKLNKTEEYLDEHADEISQVEKENLKAKNERRRASIEGFAEELKEESQLDQD